MSNGDVDSPEFWEAMYKNERTPWDLQSPTPTLVHLVEAGTLAPPGSVAVLGCGRGHDAVFLARQGFDVTAVDFAPSAVAYLRELAAQEGVSLAILEMDFFHLPQTHREAFDYVYEYTAYCAIRPVRRDEYVDLVYHILKPGGLLVGLFFPADGRTGGPPFAVSLDEIHQRFDGRFSIESLAYPATSVPPRRGKEFLALIRKKIKSPSSTT